MICHCIGKTLSEDIQAGFRRAVQIGGSAGPKPGDGGQHNDRSVSLGHEPLSDFGERRRRRREVVRQQSCGCGGLCCNARSVSETANCAQNEVDVTEHLASAIEEWAVAGRVGRIPLLDMNRAERQRIRLEPPIRGGHIADGQDSGLQSAGGESAKRRNGDVTVAAKNERSASSGRGCGHSVRDLVGNAMLAKLSGTRLTPRNVDSVGNHDNDVAWRRLRGDSRPGSVQA